MIVIGGLAGLFPALRAELTAEQRRQAQESAMAVAAGRVAEADKLQPAAAADRAAWLERRGRWLLRDEKYAEAKKDFLAAKKITPNSVPVAAGLAEVARQLGHEEEAMALINAVAELRKEQDPEKLFNGSDPGIPHIFLLQYEGKSGEVDERTIAVFESSLGDALPDALLKAARHAAKKGDLTPAHDLCTRAIDEAGGKFPAAERLGQEVSAGLARADALEPSSPELGRLRSLAEAQLANGEVYDARWAANEALKSGRDWPTFGARQLLWARVVAAVALKEDEWPSTISGVKADTMEAVAIFSRAPGPDAAAVSAATALLARLRKIEPLWPAGTLPAPAKLAADSPLRQMLTAEPLLAGSDRVVALEKAFLAEWGRGPTAVDLETAEGRARWGEISREGALIAHLRWLTLPVDSKEAVKARTDARQRTILALLCVPEDTAGMRAAKRHAWFKESGGQGYVSGNPGEFTQKLKILLAGKQAQNSAPPENGEELSALLTDVMPLAEGTIDLASTSPGIAAAVAVRVTDVVGRLRLKRQEDVAFIARPLAEFVWDWTYDPARAMDVADWGEAQRRMPVAWLRENYKPPAGLEKTPLGRHVLALDRWLWDGADAKAEPVTPASWANVPSLVWRHALGSFGPKGNVKPLLEANRSGAWGMSLSMSSIAGQAIQLLDQRLGDKFLAPMNGPAGAEWLGTLAEIEAMLKDPAVTPEVRTRLGRQLNLHRAQVLIASGQPELAKKELPELVAQLERDRSQQLHAEIMQRSQGYEGAGLADLADRLDRAKAKEELHDRVMKKEREITEAKRAAAEAEYARTHKPVVVVKVCPACSGRGGEYKTTLADRDHVYKKTDSHGLVSYSDSTDYWVKCVPCGGKGTIETVQTK